MSKLHKARLKLRNELEAPPSLRKFGSGWVSGVIGVVLGLSLVFANPIVGTAMTVLVWFWMETRIWDEEKLLTAEFGGSYTDYAHKTRKLIPFIY